MQKKLNNKMCYLKLKPIPIDCWRWCRTQRRPLCAAWGVGARGHPWYWHSDWQQPILLFHWNLHVCLANLPNQIIIKKSFNKMIPACLVGDFLCHQGGWGTILGGMRGQKVLAEHISPLSPRTTQRRSDREKERSFLVRILISINAFKQCSNIPTSITLHYES